MDFVIALSHCGILPDGSFTEDVEIAKKVDGIDVLLSGHYHVALPQAVVENGTVIVCAGTALNYLGKLQLVKNGDDWDFAYDLILLDDTWKEDAEIADLLEEYTKRIDEEYLQKYGVDKDLQEEFVYNAYDFIDSEVTGRKRDNFPYAKLLTRAYADTLQDMGYSQIQVVVVPSGTIRGGLYQGNLNVMDVYNVLSYGESPFDLSSGSPVGTACVTGKELYDICETSYSLGKYMPAVQMFFEGMRYFYSDARPILDKVYRVEIYDEATDAYVKVERDEKMLYTIAASLTTMESISLMENNSFGLMSVKPKDEAGNPLLTKEEIQNRVLMMEDGKTELKEWYLLYAYLNGMEKDETGMAVLSDEFQSRDDFMIATKAGPILFFQNPSKAGLILFAAGGAVIIFIALSVVLVVRKKRKKQHKR